MIPPKLIVILGPTASGKSSLAIKLARKFSGEIISADSRQVYKGMDIGTGKVTKKEQLFVPHHLLNVVSPKKQFTVADYKRLLTRAIAQIRHNDKLPFLVGGTAFYIYAAIDNWQIPEVKPNPKLRKSLGKKTAKELFAMLKRLDPARAKTIDKHNKVRLIRAIEIIKTTGKPVPAWGGRYKFPSNEKRLFSFPPPPDHGRGRLGGGGVILIGIHRSPKQLKKLISKSVEKRFKRGLITEVKILLKSGVTLKRLKQIGLTYALAAEYLQKGRSTKMYDKQKYQELIEKIKTAEQQLARHQMTWFKRDSRIYWIRSQAEAERLIKNFLKQKRGGAGRELHAHLYAHLILRPVKGLYSNSGGGLGSCARNPNGSLARSRNS